CGSREILVPEPARRTLRLAQELWRATPGLRARPRRAAPGAARDTTIPMQGSGAREEWPASQPGLNPEHLVFISSLMNPGPSFGRSYGAGGEDVAPSSLNETDEGRRKIATFMSRFACPDS
ncbi:MAG: hypothetical protein ACREC0_04260, partial [Methylocella sp.]